MLIRAFCISLILFLSQQASGFISDSNDSLKKNQLLPGPVINRSPETSWVFGLSFLYTFYSDKQDTITRASFLFPTFIYSLRKQQIADLYLNYWSKKNKNHFIIDLSYFKYNYYFYGTGAHTKFSNETFLSQKKTEFSFLWERRLLGPVYGGIEFVYKEDLYPSNDFNSIYNDKLLGFNGGNVSRLGFALIYDSRDNYTFATTGSYYKTMYSHTIPLLGSDFEFHRVIFESRNFLSITKRHIIGFNTNIETMQGEVPFFELRQLGNAFIMRGYYTGRYREQNLAAGQLEYRFRFANRWALAGFAGTGTVFNNSEIAALNWKPNYGLGLRYFYDLKSGINLRFDYGWGEKVPGEGRVSNYYIFVGESF